jgi:hypothetical protein
MDLASPFARLPQSLAQWHLPALCYLGPWVDGAAQGLAIVARQEATS